MGLMPIGVKLVDIPYTSTAALHSFYTAQIFNRWASLQSSLSTLDFSKLDPQRILTCILSFFYIRKETDIKAYSISSQSTLQFFHIGTIILRVPSIENTGKQNCEAPIRCFCEIFLAAIAAWPFVDSQEDSAGSCLLLQGILNSKPWQMTLQSQEEGSCALCMY